MNKKEIEIEISDHTHIIDKKEIIGKIKVLHNRIGIYDTMDYIKTLDLSDLIEYYEAIKSDVIFK